MQLHLSDAGLAAACSAAERLELEPALEHPHPGPAAGAVAVGRRGLAGRPAEHLARERQR